MPTAPRKGIELVNAYAAGTPPAAGSSPSSRPTTARRGGTRPSSRGGDAARPRRRRASTPAPRSDGAAPKAAPKAPRTRRSVAPSLDPLLGAPQMVNTRVPAALWDALHARAARAGVTLRIAVADALLSAVELDESDHTTRLRGTLIRETEARALAHDTTTAEP